MGSKKQPREPKNISHGHVPTDAFDEMNASEIAAWLKERFHDAWEGYCPSVVDIGGVIDWTQSAFPKFSPEIKTRFADALALLFDELQQQPKQWGPRKAPGLDGDHDPAWQLLVFTTYTAEHFSDLDKTKLQNKMLALLGAAGMSSDLQCRVLSSLAEIGYQAPDDFWLRQHERLPESTLTVFSTIAKQHPDDAFAFLAKQPWKIKDRESSFLSYALADIQEAHGEETVKRGIETLRKSHPEAKNQLKEIARDADGMSEHREKRAGR